MSTSYFFSLLLQNESENILPYDRTQKAFFRCCYPDIFLYVLGEIKYISI